MSRSAQTIFLHNLTGTMETAIRATNAQYDDSDILQRLDVRLLEVSYCLKLVFDIYLLYNTRTGSSKSIVNY